MCCALLAVDHAALSCLSVLAGVRLSSRPPPPPAPPPPSLTCVLAAGQVVLAMAATACNPLFHSTPTVLFVFIYSPHCASYPPSGSSSYIPSFLLLCLYLLLVDSTLKQPPPGTSSERKRKCTVTVCVWRGVGAAVHEGAPESRGTARQQRAFEACCRYSPPAPATLVRCCQCLNSKRPLGPQGKSLLRTAQVWGKWAGGSIVVLGRQGTVSSGGRRRGAKTARGPGGGGKGTLPALTVQVWVGDLRPVVGVLVAHDDRAQACIRQR